MNINNTSWTKDLQLNWRSLVASLPHICHYIIIIANVPSNLGNFGCYFFSDRYAYLKLDYTVILYTSNIYRPQFIDWYIFPHQVLPKPAMRAGGYYIPLYDSMENHIVSAHNMYIRAWTMRIDTPNARHCNGFFFEIVLIQKRWLELIVQLDAHASSSGTLCSRWNYEFRALTCTDPIL